MWAVRTAKNFSKANQKQAVRRYVAQLAVRSAPTAPCFVIT
jgi:hypothetical protein